MKNYFLSFLLLLAASSLLAQDLDLYQRNYLVSDGDTLPYRALLPKNYDASKKYPLFLFLHGAGERGNDNEKQLVHGGKLFLTDSVREAFPAIIIFPQCGSDTYWSNVSITYDSIAKKRVFTFQPDGPPTRAMRLLLKLYAQLDSQFSIDPSRKYVGGLSMGGMGTFEIARRLPGAFAAAVAICGGGDTSTAPALNHTAWWIFHGLKDDVVPPGYSMNMAVALKEAGAEVRLTLYEDANHNSWDPAFKEPDLLPWIFSHRRTVQ